MDHLARLDWCSGAVWAAVAAVVLWFFYDHFATVAARRRVAAEARRRQEQAERDRAAWEAGQRNLALTCRRCHALAPPIPGTGNRYRCGGCGRQFAGARHGW